jgi:hypothetical protein
LEQSGSLSQGCFQAATFAFTRSEFLHAIESATPARLYPTWQALEKSQSTLLSVVSSWSVHARLYAVSLRLYSVRYSLHCQICSPIDLCYARSDLLYPVKSTLHAVRLRSICFLRGRICFTRSDLLFMRPGLQLYVVDFQMTRSGLNVTRSALSKLVQTSFTGSIAVGFSLGGESSESEVGLNDTFGSSRSPSH